jgi:hypothetical protein
VPRSTRPIIALLLSLLGLYIGLTVLVTGMSADGAIQAVLLVGATLAVTGAIAVPFAMVRVFRSALREQHERTERELYAVVREHLLYDSQFTAPPEAPTVVDFEARRAAGKDTMP